jgi:thiamine biosynthesis lipoprotein
MNIGHSRSRRRFVAAGLAALGVGAVTPAALRALTADGRGEFQFTGDAMGSTYAVRFVAAKGDALLREAARAAVDQAIAAVDARMSTFAADSEVSRLNAHPADRAFALSADTFTVLAAAHGVSAATQGAFDVTAGPLVNAWGFGPDRHPRIPSLQERARLRERVGFRGLELDAGSRNVRKAHSGMYVDLSGIAKGHAADRAGAALNALGIADYVIELGGEVLARGRNIAGDAWRVGIEEPQALPRKIRHVVPLVDRAMATSGDYRIYFERDGRRYCHEIDPVSASPVTHALTSVTVAAADCAKADALATALMVLGPDAGYAFAESTNVAAYFVTRVAGGGLADRATSAFAAPSAA